MHTCLGPSLPESQPYWVTEWLPALLSVTLTHQSPASCTQAENPNTNISNNKRTGYFVLCPNGTRRSPHTKMATTSYL
jgi:hypothetical protein